MRLVFACTPVSVLCHCLQTWQTRHGQEPCRGGSARRGRVLQRNRPHITRQGISNVQIVRICIKPNYVKLYLSHTYTGCPTVPAPTLIGNIFRKCQLNTISF